MTVPTCRTWRSARWLLLLGWLCACGADERYVVIGTARASSTSGTVEVDELGGDETQVSVHLEFLHPPEHIDESLTQYMLWFLPVTGAPVNGGALVFDPAQRTANLTATSPFRHFSVKITAERPGPAKAPSDYVVATQDISLD